MVVTIELSHAFLAGVEVGLWFPSTHSTMLIAASVTGRVTWLNVPYAKAGASNMTLTGRHSNVKDAPEMVEGSVPVVAGILWCLGLWVFALETVLQANRGDIPIRPIVQGNIGANILGIDRSHEDHFGVIDKASALFGDYARVIFWGQLRRKTKLDQTSGA